MVNVIGKNTTCNRDRVGILKVNTGKQKCNYIYTQINNNIYTKQKNTIVQL